MHCIGVAERWLQPIERNLPTMKWQVLCTLIHEHFNRDQPKLLIRQLFHIKQTSSITEYVERFVELVDQLTAYTTSIEPLYYIMRFIDGLCDDIRSVILVQCPNDLDNACTLALLQEEAGDHDRRREFKKFDSSLFSKSASTKGAVPITPPPPHPTPVVPVEKKKHVLPDKMTSTYDKLYALRAYRKARGLCICCAEKCSFGHRCALAIQLHVLQELFDLYQDDEEEDSETLETVPAPKSSEQLFMLLFVAAISG